MHPHPGLPGTLQAKGCGLQSGLHAILLGPDAHWRILWCGPRPWPMMWGCRPQDPWRFGPVPNSLCLSQDKVKSPPFLADLIQLKNQSEHQVGSFFL